MSFCCHRFDQNSNKNIVRISVLKFYVASWGLPGIFYGLPGDLVIDIIIKEAYKKPQKAFRKPPGSYKKFQGRNPYNIFVAILENQCPHKFILSLTDLYIETRDGVCSSLIIICQEIGLKTPSLWVTLTSIPSLEF